MIRALVFVAFTLACHPAAAGDISIEDKAMSEPVAPEVPGGAKPVLRDCKVTKTSTTGPGGEEIEHTRRVCRWAVPSAPDEP